MTSETLLVFSSCAALLMLCCAIASCIDLWNMQSDVGRESTQSSSLFRSAWFFYTNAALCLSCVFALFWLG